MTPPCGFYFDLITWNFSPEIIHWILANDFCIVLFRERKNPFVARTKEKIFGFLIPYTFYELDHFKTRK